jgi:Cdc6-like AAA superfamily ATPase
VTTPVAPTPEPEPPAPDYSAAACIKKREEMHEGRLNSVLISVFEQCIERGYACISTYTLGQIRATELITKLKELGYITSGDVQHGLRIDFNQ